MFRSSQRSVHSNSAFRKHELAARPSWKNTDVLNLAYRIYLHPPSVLTSIGSLDLYEDYLSKDLARVFQLNQLARSNKDLILSDGHGQPCQAPRPRNDEVVTDHMKSRQVCTVLLTQLP